MFLSNNKLMVDELNAKVADIGIIIEDAENCSDKEIFELTFNEATSGGTAFGFYIKEGREGYLSFNQFFDNILVRAIHDIYNSNEYPQLIILLPAVIVGEFGDELTERHLFPIVKELDDELALIVVRKKDLISYHDKHKKEYETLNKSISKAIKVVENTPSTLPTTFSNIYSKLPVIILSITFVFLFIIFFYDNFINIVKSERKPTLSANKYIVKHLNDIGTFRGGNELLIDALLSNKEIPSYFIISYAKDTDKYIILQNKNTPHELIAKAINSNNENDKIAVALNQSLADDEVDKLANDSSMLVRSNLATNPTISHKVMLHLAKDSLTVQDGLLENNALTGEIYDMLLKGRVVDCELNKVIFSSPLTTVAELTYYQDSANECIREGVALNKNLPAEIVEKYIDSGTKQLKINALMKGVLSKKITDRYFGNIKNIEPVSEQDFNYERELLLLNPNLAKNIYEEAVLISPYATGATVAKRDNIDNDTLTMIIAFAESYGGVDKFIDECKAIADNTKALADVIKTGGSDKLALIRYVKREVNRSFIRNIYDPYLTATLIAKYKLYSDYDNLSYIKFNDVDIIARGVNKRIPLNFSDNVGLMNRINLLDKSEKITFETIKLADNITYSTTVYLLRMIKKSMLDNKLGNTQNIDEFLSRVSAGVIADDERLKAFILKSLKPLNNFYD